MTLAAVETHGLLLSHRYINISVFGANPTKKVEKARAKAEKNAIKRADELAKKEHEQQMKELQNAN